MKNAYMVGVNSLIPFSLGVLGRGKDVWEVGGTLSRDGLLAGTEVFK